MDSPNTSSLTRQYLPEIEALASPFASIASFRACSTTLEIEHLADHLSGRYQKLSINERPNKHLKGLEAKEQYINKFVINCANRFLETDGATARLKVIHDQPGSEILRWRWLSLALPPDLILSGLIESRARSVRILDRSLRILEPTAHLHLHATAAIPFSDIWTTLVSGNFKLKLKSYPCGFASTCEWHAWLRRAFVARYALQYWMRHGFDELSQLLQRYPQVGFALGDLRHGTIREQSRMLEAQLDAYLRWANHHLRYLEHRHHPPREVPYSKRSYQQPTGTSGADLSFNRRCFAYMESAQCSDRLQIFRPLWVQMTRIRVLLYRHLVYDPADSNLDKFKCRFDRLNEYTNADELDEVQAAATQEPGIVLETLELRKTPGPVSKLEKLHRLSTGRKDQQDSESLHGGFDKAKPKPRITWTLHFIRDKDSDKCLVKQARNHYMRAWHLAAVFRYQPELLKSIRGLDVAGREPRGPLWALTMPLQHVRDESSKLAAKYLDIEPLRLTVHVGEDFPHLLTGLRAIHEPFRWRLMRRGDRLGHASALGREPAEWCSKHPLVKQSRCERMLDLAWMLEFVCERNLQVQIKSLLAARKELRQHLQGWPGKPNLATFLEVASTLGAPRVWQQIDSINRINLKRTQPYWNLLKEFLQRYTKTNDCVCIKTNEDMHLLEVIRDELARLLSLWRTPIEINPSSNLLVGDLRHPVAQPLFHLDPHDRKERRSLVLTLSADDPVCFATTLADEYAYAWAGIVVGNDESPAYAQEWLERAARAARRAAF